MSDKETIKVIVFGLEEKRHSQQIMLWINLSQPPLSSNENQGTISHPHALSSSLLSLASDGKGCKIQFEKLLKIWGWCLGRIGTSVK